MRKRIKKQQIDEQLLDSISVVEQEWKQIRQLIEESIEPMESSIQREKITQAKYLFLLGVAKKRGVTAIRYI